MKIKNLIVALGVMVTIIGCSNDNSSDEIALVAADYLTPANNSICEGTVLPNDEGIEVFFSWNPFTSDAGASINYTINLTDMGTNEVQTIQVINGTTNATVTLKPNTVYNWEVTATNAQGTTVTGATGQFQTPHEAVSNYAPFPANLLQPQNEGTVSATASTMAFDWEGNDPDAGESVSLKYELYLGTTTNPTVVANNLTSSEATVNYSLTGGTTYYWKVKSVDVNGNASYSQLWSFKATN